MRFTGNAGGSLDYQLQPTSLRRPASSRTQPSATRNAVIRSCLNQSNLRQTIAIKATAHAALLQAVTLQIE